MNTVRNSLNCIVPDFMLEKLAENAPTARVREWALRALVASARLRGQRDILSMTSSPTPAGRKRRSIHDARNNFGLPGDLVRDEGEPATGDNAVNEVFEGLGATYDLFFEEYERNSLDGRGHPLIATVHYGEDFGNAFWNGNQMVFGDGDGEIFLSFTGCIDIIAHELTHGVVEFSSQLVYARQPGALNESFADVFGSLVKQRVLNQTADEADWLVGAGLLGPTVKGVALRSMKDPGTAYNDPRLGKDPQPGHMKDYNPTSRDNFGVHINSGIPNRAFYLIASRLGGPAWEEAGQIWYATLLQLNPYSEFQQAADITYQVAELRYGVGSEEQQAVRDAWSQVGIRVAGAKPIRRRLRRRVEAAADNFSDRLDQMKDELEQRLSEVISRHMAPSDKSVLERV
jgi:Zn-dependent metalloprotease